MAPPAVDRREDSLYVVVAALALLANGPEYFLGGDPIDLLTGTVPVLALVSVAVPRIRGLRPVVAVAFVALVAAMGRSLLAAETVVARVFYGLVILVGAEAVANQFGRTSATESG